MSYCREVDVDKYNARANALKDMEAISTRVTMNLGSGPSQHLCVTAVQLPFRYELREIRGNRRYWRRRHHHSGGWQLDDTIEVELVPRWIAELFDTIYMEALL